MAKFKVYLLRQYAYNQKIDGELPYSKTISKFYRDRFLIFILVRRHVTFKVMAFHHWQTNFASYEELTDSSVVGVFIDVRVYSVDEIYELLNVEFQPHVQAEYRLTSQPSTLVSRR